ncbi:MAG TPA: hypothetical protein VLH08_20580 [Acidobacteriota bacterium]|nr:hypothetical protein [Acidobacteriota bacterium]
MIKNVGIGIGTRITSDSEAAQQQEPAISPKSEAGVGSIRDSFQTSYVRDGLNADLVDRFTSNFKVQAELPKGPTPGNPANLNPQLTPTGFQRLFTGSGDDRVDIAMGSDNRVHVNVNGKEAWSGTLRQFQNLQIDTGAGNDSVNNTVSGAKISTGAGNDTVQNHASGTTIDTGIGNDVVTNQGDNNVINTGSDGDSVTSVGNSNKLDAGEGNDSITSIGNQNALMGGDGEDGMIIVGNRNLFDGGEGYDNANVIGNDNVDREAWRRLAEMFKGK